MFEQAFKNIDDVLRKEAGCTTELDYTEQTSWLLFLKYLDGLEQDKAAEAQLEGKKHTYILEKPYRWESWAAPKGKDGKLDHNTAMTGDDLRDFVNQKLFPYLHGFTQKASGPNTIEYKIGQIFAEIRNKINSGYNLREIIDHIDELRFRSQKEKHELSHFSPAVQLGLTATPKRKDNVDTYAYFGEPVYIYSLKEGINDGFLTPFKVKQISTTLDEYVYTPDDKLVEGEIEAGKRYTESDFNKIIEIKEREAHRVKIFMDQINQNEKTIVFCATQDHALAVRDLINQMKTSKDPNYCHRVTAEDGALGDQYLRAFQDNEKTIPTVLTTSQKLSTGVDARNVRNIVLMRPVNSMIEFKQIIGRGTRLYDGKDYFTIYDFVKAHQHFNDPEWDGEPLEPEPKPRCGVRPCVCERPPPKQCEVCAQTPCVCEPKPCQECGQYPCECPKIAKIQLADGKVRNIQHMMVT